MNTYLAFTLYAPMGACGGIAPGSSRETQAWPGRSTVLGIIAGAMGETDDIRKQPRWPKLEEELEYAVRIDASGTKTRDYQTVRSVTSGSCATDATRREALATGRTFTTISNRTWLANPFYTALVWNEHGKTELIEWISEALARPMFSISLGRAAGLIGLNPRPEQIVAQTMVEAFTKRIPDAIEEKVLQELRISRKDQVPIIYDAKIGNTPSPQRVMRQRDVAADRERWTFNERTVHMAYVTPGEQAKQ